MSATQTQAQEAFAARMAEKHITPLWTIANRIVMREPTPKIPPVYWNYQRDVRPYILEAAEVISAAEAHRRVLVLNNPTLKHGATHTLTCAIQLIKGGEVAPAHRHSQAALRFVIEGTAAYTAVEGERTTMHPGDFILTPSWTYHDHGNPGADPVVWLDGLDVPIVNLFDTSFFERHPAERQPNTIPEGDALARYGANMLPVDYAPQGHSSPIFNYPYSRSRAALEQLYRDGPVHACHGVKMRYINPSTGGYPMPTIGAFIQLLPKGFRGEAYRATDATVFSVVEGKGRTKVGDQTFDWGPRDLFVAPSWCPVSHEAEQEAVVFSFSDRPAQQVLGLWREEAPMRQ